MKVAIIIQVRMGSTRLPGKSMMLIAKKPLIWHVVERAKKSKEADCIIIATTTETGDEPIHGLFEGTGVKCFAGSTDDVLDRYYNAAALVRADMIVRITGDSPLVDPHLIDKAVGIFKKGKYDYVSNTEKPCMDGFDVEVFSFNTLEDAWKSATMASEREHVTAYINKNARFKRFYLANDLRLEHVHCSVDRKEDLEFVRGIYKILLAGGKDHSFTFEDVIRVLEQHPELLEINKGSIINEGYAKSLREDRKVK